MFSGIVEGLGRLHEIPRHQLVLEIPSGLQPLRMGQSLAVEGCCLTVKDTEKNLARFDLTSETCDRTNFGSKLPGDMLNLERGIRMGESIDGHFVTGHIDGVASIRSVDPSTNGSRNVWINVGLKGRNLLVEKGSVALSGVSLTVNEIDADGFSVTLIPHTIDVTSLGMRKVGDRVNIEFDLFGKYVQKLLQLNLPGRGDSKPHGGAEGEAPAALPMEGATRAPINR